MAPGGVEPPHADSKSAALSTELRGRAGPGHGSAPGRSAAVAAQPRRPNGLGLLDATTEELVDQRGGHRSFTDGRGHPLDGAVAYVACDEDAGLARLEEQRSTVERPGPAAAFLGGDEVGSGDEEPAPVSVQDPSGNTTSRSRDATSIPRSPSRKWTASRVAVDVRPSGVFARRFAARIWRVSTAPGVERCGRRRYRGLAGASLIDQQP